MKEIERFTLPLHIGASPYLLGLNILKRGVYC